MSIWFFTDPHLGLMRTSHTTQASRLRLREALFRLAARLPGITGCSDPLYCLGDLFDTESNDEQAILEGYKIASTCTRVLAGNHDLPNREGKLSSLQLISEMLEDDQVVMGKVDEPGFALSQEGNAAVFMVPHLATQELFDTSLEEVNAYALDGWKQSDHVLILCLHCNYNSGLIHNDASLNLTAERTEKLLETFDYVLLGHEHMPRTLHNGRLIILGNTHPTSFSDISDKFIWEFDGQRFIQHPIWSKSDGYLKIKPEGVRFSLPDEIQFVEVVGEVPSDQLPEVAKNIANLWKDNPNLLMVRNNVTTAECAISVDVSQHRSLDLPSRISTALLDTDLHAVWQHYKEAAQ